MNKYIKLIFTFIIVAFFYILNHFKSKYEDKLILTNTVRYLFKILKFSFSILLSIEFINLIIGGNTDE